MDSEERCAQVEGRAAKGRGSRGGSGGWFLFVKERSAWWHARAEALQG